jgi:hypothetical protein
MDLTYTYVPKFQVLMDIAQFSNYKPDFESRIFYVEDHRLFSSVKRDYEINK